VDDDPDVQFSKFEVVPNIRALFLGLLVPIERSPNWRLIWRREGGAVNKKFSRHHRLGEQRPIATRRVDTSAMTEVPSTALGHLNRLDLSTITPSSVVATSLLSGIITIKWPFSSSAQNLTFLLADPDPRKRAQGGQVKITLIGDAAEYLDQIESGEQISVAAPENTPAPLVDTETETPRVKFHLTFPQGCILLVLPPVLCNFTTS